MNKAPEFARQLRKDQTEAERYLWQLLRGRRLSGYKFRRQHPVGRFVLDFYCAKKRLAIELDGGQHTEDGQARYDQERTTFLAKKGIKILRIWDNEMFLRPNEVLDKIIIELDDR